MADGIQIAELSGGLLLRDVRLSDNARVGLLLEGDLPTGAPLSVTGVEISGAGQFGLILPQGQDPPAGWQVTRSPALSEADAGFTGRLEAASPRGLIPGVALVRDRGLLGEGGLLSDSGEIREMTRVADRGLTPENG
jgi:hypothetical protein